MKTHSLIIAAALCLLLPSMAAADDVLRVVLLRDYNTRVVVFGATLLGVACGVVGTFLVLRKRALLSDAVAHATLPGVAAAFLLGQAFGLEGRSLPLLLGGAVLAGLLGMGAVLGIRRVSCIQDDAALGIVLSVFFGAGVAVLGVAQRLPGATTAGLSSFIYGKAASMLLSDTLLILLVGGAAVVACVLFFKEFLLLCFDHGFAQAGGWPVLRLDMLLMGLVVAVTVVGLQAVGLILVVALLVIPASAARFWSHRLERVVLVAAGIGGASGCVGTMLSALAPDLPAGAIIVLVAATLFTGSAFFGTARGLCWRWRDARQLERSVAREHLLRAIHEQCEGNHRESCSGAQLGLYLGWDGATMRRELRRAERLGFLALDADGAVRLSPAGAVESTRIVRNHRLWELFLIHHAEIAPQFVDRSADTIEHVLDEEMIAALEALLPAPVRQTPVPPSPHDLEMGDSC